jgi:hypothetical protein
LTLPESYDEANSIQSTADRNATMIKKAAIAKRFVDIDPDVLHVRSPSMPDHRPESLSALCGSAN